MKKVFIFVLFLSLTLIGCSNQLNDQNNISNNDNLICESILSPNEEYVEKAEDKVVYEIKIYQKENNSIVVTAQANTAFFDDMSYIVEYDKEISKSDISVEWTTLMGNPKATKEDQIGVATILIKENDKIISKRKINFVKKAIEIIVEGTNNK